MFYDRENCLYAVSLTTLSHLEMFCLAAAFWLFIYDLVLGRFNPHFNCSTVLYPGNYFIVYKCHSPYFYFSPYFVCQFLVIILSAVFTRAAVISSQQIPIHYTCWFQETSPTKGQQVQALRRPLSQSSEYLYVFYRLIFRSSLIY